MLIDLDLIAVIILVIGIILCIIEIFVPSFGIIGGLGIIGIITGIVLTADTFVEGALIFLCVIVILSIVFLIAWRFLIKNNRSGLILKSVVNKEEQAIGELMDLLGKNGKSLTPLRPSGIADFDGVRLDVLTKGDFISPHTDIVISEIIGKKIIVKKL